MSQNQTHSQNSEDDIDAEVEENLRNIANDVPPMGENLNQAADAIMRATGNAEQPLVIDKNNRKRKANDRLIIELDRPLAESYQFIADEIEKWRISHNFYWKIEQLPIDLLVVVRDKPEWGDVNRTAATLRRLGNGVVSVKFPGLKI